jgi:hypothetical protein
VDLPSNIQFLVDAAPSRLGDWKVLRPVAVPQPELSTHFVAPPSRMPKLYAVYYARTPTQATDLQPTASRFAALLVRYGPQAGPGRVAVGPDAGLQAQVASTSAPFPACCCRACRSLAGVFEVPVTVLHIYVHRHTRTIAFNYTGLLYVSMHGGNDG